MLEKYPKKVKLVHKFFPHSREFSLKAATAALAADEQGKFWEFHDKLFENQGALNGSMVIEIAEMLKMDVDRFRKKMQDPAIGELIDRDLNDARELDIRRTPQVYINGRLLKELSFSGLVDAIDRELKK